MRTKRIRPLLLALSLVLGGAFTVHSANDPPDNPTLQRAIVQLGDISAKAREEATRVLWSAGKAAEPLLEEAATNPDPEIAARARQILADFRLGISPTTPPDIIALVREYRGGLAPQKRTAVDRLTDMGSRGLPYLAHLAQIETDRALRADVFGKLAQKAPEGANLALIDQDLQTARLWLQIGCADGGSDGERNLAAFYLLNGELDEKLADIAAGRQEHPSPVLIAMMERARGNLPAALHAAQASQDDSLIDNILYEQGNWQELARRHPVDQVNPQDIEQIGFAASYHRLAGHLAESSKLLDLAVKLADADPENVRHAATALLLNDQPEQAIDLYKRKAQPMPAMELLLAQQRYDEAIKLARTQIAAGAGGDALRLSLVRAYYTLGENQEAARLGDVLLGNVADAGTRGMLIEIERDAGQENRAIQHAAEALDARGDAAPAALEALYPEQSPQAAAWYSFFRRQDASASPKTLLLRVRDVLDGKFQGEELDKLALKASQEPGNAPLPTLRALAATLRDAGRDQAATTLLTRAAQLADEAQDELELAAIAMKKEDWKASDEALGRALAKDKGDAAAIYLRGICLTRLGQQQPGQKLIQQAKLLPLADDSRRRALAEAMRLAHQNQPARNENELILRTSEFNSAEMGIALRQEWIAAQTRGDFARSAALMRRSTLDCLHQNTYFNAQSLYLMMPAAIHRDLGFALLKDKHLEEGLKELDIAQKLFPQDDELVITGTALLEAAGQKEKADALFERVISPQRKLAEKYPQSAAMHNAVGWLEVRCRRNIADGLADAIKAAELSPRNTAILDTLAEAYFQAGDKDKAIETIQRCIHLEPQQHRHQLCLERFKSGSPQTPPPPAYD